jgi:hypothetical protein
MTTPVPAGAEPQDGTESPAEPGIAADDLDEDASGDDYEPV